MNSRKKIIKISIGLVIAGVLLLLLTAKLEKPWITHGSSSKNVRGWLWSENVGWVSTNCYNDYDGDGEFENCCPGGSDCPYTNAGANYGLTYDKDNSTLSGYGWASENSGEGLGWVCFGSTCTGTAPDGYSPWACVGKRKSNGTCAADCGECFNVPSTDTCTTSGDSSDCPLIATGTDTNLKAHWPLNSLSGSNNDTVIDISGYNNHGTIKPNAANGPILATGKWKNALKFDGTDDYVSFGNSTFLQIASGTVEAWINTSNAGASYRGIVAKQNAYGMFLKDNEFGIYDWGTSTWRGTGVSLNDSKWHHVAFTFQSGVSNGTILYVDGVPKLTTTMTVLNQNVELQVGWANSAGQYFTGLIDNVAIYSRVKTAEEIWDDAHIEISGWAKVVNLDDQGWMKLKGQTTNGDWWGSWLNKYSLGGDIYTIAGFGWQTDVPLSEIPYGWYKGPYIASSTPGPPIPGNFDTFRVINYGCTNNTPNLYLKWSPSQWAEYYNYYRVQNAGPASNCPACPTGYTEYPALANCSASECQALDNKGTILQNTGYCYCLKAFNETGSTWATNNPPNYPHPYWKKTPFCPPTNIAVDGSVCGYNKVAWQPDATMASNADGYNIYRSLTYNGCGTVGGTLNDLINGVIGGTCELVGQAGEALMTFNPTNGEESLVGWWKMNESSWNGTSGEVWDSSGKGNHGTAYGNATTTTGKFKNAGSFDGQDDYVKVSDASGLGLEGSAWTVEAWVKPIQLKDYGNIFEKFPGNLTSGWGIITFANGSWDFQRYAGGWGNVEGGPSGTLVNNQWTHIAVTYDGTNIRTYNNGVLYNTQTQGTITDNNLDLHIGADLQYSRYFKGLIDNVAIYNRAKSAAEILKDAEAFPLETTPSGTNNTCSIGSSGATALPIYCPNQTEPPSDCVNCTGNGNFCFTCGGSNPNCCRFYDKRIVPGVSYFYQVTVFTSQGGESSPSSIPSGHSSGCLNSSSPTDYRRACDKSVCYPPIKFEEK